ncbi:MAG: hypothetical protein ACR2ND_04825 [Solirubrobacteraceae bacterium]
MGEDAQVAIEQLCTADGRWEAALQASAEALPNDGFAGRVRDIADASEQEAAAFRYANSLELGWRSRQNVRTMQLSYELRRGGTRPGPSDLWERFDAAVETLGSALEGVALSAIARAFAELSEVARELARDIEVAYSPTATRRQAS